MQVDGTCTVPGCRKPLKVKSLGACGMHYSRWRLTGGFEPGPRARYMALPLLERYESRVDRSGGPDACHPWTGPCFPSGYGQFPGDGEQRAHRFGYKRLVGPIPKGLQVCHSCDNPPCQNRRHWFLGTPVANAADKVAKGRQQRLTGDQGPGAKLTWTQVREIRAKFTGKRGEKAALAREYGISQTTLGRIVAGRIWRSE